MPSSRTAPATSRPVGPSSAKVLLELLAAVPDPRRPRGVRHSLPGLLAVAIAAVVSGARSFAAIGQWVGDADADLLAALGFRYGRRPSESATRRAFGRLDAAGLDVVPGAWMWTRTHVVGRRRVITIDAKTIRGARTINTTAPHLVAAFDHGRGVVLGQLAIAAKSNEIPAVRTLLATFDLRGVVVTVDALCRRRHKASYADVVVMPMGPEESWVGRGIGSVRSAYSQVLQEGDEPVGRVVAAGCGSGRCGSCEGLLLDREVGVDVDLCGRNGFVAEPERNDGAVDT
jgi:predicted transposase YbfD/YdcC